jgi:ribosomal protein S18 acetylase RimI-like enzyme
MGTIEYRRDHPIAPAEIARLLDASGIVRPTQDVARIGRMYSQSSFVISAWDDGRLVGLCRGLTDFSYTCYLSDLAVDRSHQRRGIGRELVRRSRDLIGENVALLLLSAPEAMEYYPKLGFDNVPNAFFIKRKY